MNKNNTKYNPLIAKLKKKKKKKLKDSGTGFYHIHIWQIITLKHCVNQTKKEMK